jgi:hypothetical protein
VGNEKKIIWVQFSIWSLRFFVPSFTRILIKFAIFTQNVRPFLFLTPKISYVSRFDVQGHLHFLWLCNPVTFTCFVHPCVLRVYSRRSPDYNELSLSTPLLDMSRVEYTRDTCTLPTTDRTCADRPTSCCFLLSDKARAKKKTYIWVSVWWKTKS